jgi:hypothetical protein
MNIEKWKSHPDFDNYLFSNNGVIKNIKTNKIIKGSLRDNKLRTQLIDNSNKKTSLMIHNVIAFLFVENKNNYNYVNHIDGNKNNNVYTNLEYVSTYLNINLGNFIENENEKWKEIEINKNYEVSNNGRVRNKLTKYLMNQRCYDGYMSCSIGNNKKSLIHILVANAFISKVENKNSVDHIDKNRSNNNVNNLRWATSKEQCENRNWSKGNYYRKIQCIDENTNKIIKIYDKVDDAVNYIFDNIETTATKSSIKSTLFIVLQKKKNKSYGYTWKYENDENNENNEEIYENEIWKSVKEIIPEANDYKISSLGRVKNPNNYIVHGADSCGYKSIYIGIKGRRHKIHILVAKLFIPNSENKRCVNHIDGDKNNNCLENLEWNTHSENTQHAMDNNLNSCCKKIKITYIDTKIEIVYPTITKLVSEIKISRVTIKRYIEKKEPYNNMLFQLI